MKKTNCFQNKTVLVIGGSSGIGLEVIKQLLGWAKQIINCSRTQVSLVGVINYNLDISDTKHFLCCLNDIKAKYLVDYVVYTAGYSVASPLEQIEISDYQHLFTVNLFGFIQTLQMFLTKMPKHPQFVAVSSIGSVIPIPFDPYYTASKAALNALIEGIKLEFPNLKITTIIPGGVRTPFTFKRNVYQVDNPTIWQKFDNANATLTKIEQKGLDPVVVAKKIIKTFQTKRVPLIKVVGLNNKVYYLLSRILPKRLLLTFISIKFKLYK